MCTICQTLHPEDPIYTFHETSGTGADVAALEGDGITLDAGSVTYTPTSPMMLDGVSLDVAPTDLNTQDDTGQPAADTATDTHDHADDHDHDHGPHTEDDATDHTPQHFNSYNNESVGVGDGSGTGGKPVYSLDQIADQLTEGYWSGGERSFDLNASKDLTVNLTKLTADGKFLARAALETWADVTGINFIETSNTNAQMRFDDNQSGAFASSYTGFFGDIAYSKVNISTQWLNSYGTSLTSYNYQTYIHEIGHALGLGHAGNYNGGANYNNDAHYANDSWQASIMSYFSETQNSFVDAKFAYVVTPQMADVLAIQNLYGSNNSQQNTVYGTGATSDANMNILGNTAATIYDGGGHDTINLSGNNHDQRLDLNAESFSDTNGQIGNLAIARGTVIESAVTGRGNDVVIGNEANNSFSTGLGNDMVYGNGGNDVINTGPGRDTVDGGSGSDTYILWDTLGDYNVIYDYSAFTGTHLKVVEGAGNANTLIDIEWVRSGADNYSISSIIDSLVDYYGAITNATTSYVATLTDHIGLTEPDPAPAPAPAPTPPAPQPAVVAEDGTDLTLANNNVSGYGGHQDKGTATISADKSAITLENNAWKQLDQDFTINADTVLSFDFSSFKEGEVHAIGFANDNGSAAGSIARETIFQLDGSQTMGVIQDFNGTYNNNNGATKSYEINVGEYFTGNFDRMVFLMDDDARIGADSTFSNINVSSLSTVEPDPVEEPVGSALDIQAGRLSSYGHKQDKGTATVSADKSAITLENNAWKQLDEDFTITADSVLSFDFSSFKEGEVHAIGFANDSGLNNQDLAQSLLFQLDGSQSMGVAIQDFAGTYNNNGAVKSYEINVGEYLTGTFDRMVFLMDDDARVGADSTFSNIELF